MDAVTFLSRYVLWHYTQAWADLTRVFTNLVWFCWRIFSIPELVANLLTPFQRLDEHASGNMPGAVGSAFLVSTIMRLVGAVVRLPIILIGLLLTVCVVAVWLAAYLTWLFVPLLAPILVGFGIMKLFGIA